MTNRVLVSLLWAFSFSLIVNLLIWNRDADLGRLAVGGAVIALSLWVNARGDHWGSDAGVPPESGRPLQAAGFCIHFRTASKLFI